jgi:cytosine/adenosine deaminase-related metal-dependent hydrolase
MKRLAAQYIITNSGPPLKRAVVTTEDDGTIISIEDTAGDLKEKHSTEFYNGIIVPGFVNCHSLLELSHMKGCISEGEGLGGFIEKIRSTRDNDTENTYSSMSVADNNMCKEGIVLCADICNSILEELKTLQFSFPEISIEDLIFCATSNGARALGEEDRFGKIEPGKNPGLLLLQNVDLINMKLLPESFVTRLI